MEYSKTQVVYSALYNLACSHSSLVHKFYRVVLRWPRRRITCLPYEVVFMLDIKGLVIAPSGFLALVVVLVLVVVE